MIIAFFFQMRKVRQRKFKRLGQNQPVPVSASKARAQGVRLQNACSTSWQLATSQYVALLCAKHSFLFYFTILFFIFWMLVMIPKEMGHNHYPLLGHILQFVKHSSRRKTPTQTWLSAAIKRVEAGALNSTTQWRWTQGGLTEPEADWGWKLHV